MNVKLSSVVTLKDGVRCEAVSRNHTIIFDEPIEDGGKDTALNPMEGLLASLGGCQAITAKFIAKPNGIKLNHFSIEVQGEYNLSGYEGDKHNIGFHYIQLIMHIDADNTKEEIEKFAEAVEAHCPVSETIKRLGNALPTKVICE